MRVYLTLACIAHKCHARSYWRANSSVSDAGSAAPRFSGPAIARNVRCFARCAITALSAKLPRMLVTTLP
jgi:hypothetical protein